MKKPNLSFVVVAALAIASVSALVAPSVAFAAGPSRGAAKAAIGAVTPSWTGTDSAGKSEAIDQYRGHYVVLEWTNPECPFVKKHYDSGNMQASQEKAAKMGAIWLSIDSSGPGNVGYVSPAEANAYRSEHHVKSHATIIDSDGTIGHIYEAKTTPTIVVIDPKGVVIYKGAIDDRPTADPSDIPGATNYALTTLREAMAGKPVAVSSTRSYGCGIKY